MGRMRRLMEAMMKEFQQTNVKLSKDTLIAGVQPRFKGSALGGCFLRSLTVDLTTPRNKPLPLADR